MGIFSCPCVLSGWCVYGGDRGFVKTFTTWQKLASLENTGGGTGGYSFPRITAVDLMATFDNSYRKCYNKRSDDNKNVISHQTVKFALYGVFPLQGIKSRRTAKNAVQRIYIKFGNTKTAKICAVGGKREKSYLYIGNGSLC